MTAEAGELNFILLNVNCATLAEVVSGRTMDMLTASDQRLPDLQVLARYCLHGIDIDIPKQELPNTPWLVKSSIGASFMLSALYEHCYFMVMLSQVQNCLKGAILSNLTTSKV